MAIGMKIRRVVTGHNDNGEAIIQLDDVIQGVEAGGEKGTAEAAFALVWSTDQFPSSNEGEFYDGAKRQVGTANPGGTVFRIVDLAPGHRSPMHRTHSLDYGIVIYGEIEMELDAGRRVQLKAGDVVVQRGTIHSWTNIGTTTSRMAFVLNDAAPVKFDGEVLPVTHG